MTDSLPDPIPASVREVLALFEDELEGVRFGDLDAAILQAMAEEVRLSSREVDEARALLEAAQSKLERDRLALVARADEALAYARIYAAREPALAPRLDALPRGEPAAPAKPRKIRKRKTDGDEVVELDFASELAKTGTG